MEKVPYFAYGSNLDPNRMKERIGRIPQSQLATLTGYQLAFNKRASSGGVYANIIEKPDQEVWGVVYWCTKEEMEELDKYEGVTGGHYHRTDVHPRLEDGELVDAITYVAGNDFICHEGSPSKAYLQCIISGARQHGLPEKYVVSIEASAAQSNSAG